MTILFKKQKKSIEEITKILEVFDQMEWMTNEAYEDCPFKEYEGTELADLNNKIDGLKTRLELKLAEMESEKLESWVRSFK